MLFSTYSSTCICLVVFLTLTTSWTSAARRMASSGAAQQDTFRLATYYSDHMVLQRAPDSAVIWGFAKPATNITLIFKEMKYTAIAEVVSYSSEGVWKVTLEPQPPSGPFTIKITADNGGVVEVVELQDILFGDVWVCSGQSNMAFDVKAAFNSSEALEQSYQYTNIRLLAITEVMSTTPLYDLTSIYEPWSLPTPATLGADNAAFQLYFSAVCWFFGRDLFDHLQYPIGLISVNWGGTPIESWSSPRVLKQCNMTAPLSSESTYKQRSSHPMRLNETKFEKRTTGKPFIYDGPKAHYILWNAMIHPLLNMSIKGAIWYQGEDNAVADPSTYNCLFPAMINDWREQWYIGTGQHMSNQFPFGFVQLCNSEYPEPGNANFTSLRWHQTADYGYVPNPTMPGVFMAVAIDLPDVKSPHGPVHPRDKQDVSARLVLGARDVAYNESYVTFQGPFPSSVVGMTNQIQIQFNSGKVQLDLINNEGFDVCCAQTVTDCPIQGNMSWTPTNITDSFQNSTINIKDPCLFGQGVAVRYIWRDLPCQFKKCPLYDSMTKLPVPPFFLPVSSRSSKQGPGGEKICGKKVLTV
ncbi:sialate O-acetylesterase-like [Diadema antillarum]|uniref:sialate O-acetylesterase-like n=1 Tax=Diadema antillarum TaxID=105358 RepID=UPI003A8817B8